MLALENHCARAQVEVQQQNAAVQEQFLLLPRGDTTAEKLRPPIPNVRAGKRRKLSGKDTAQEEMISSVLNAQPDKYFYASVLLDILETYTDYLKPGAPAEQQRRCANLSVFMGRRCEHECPSSPNPQDQVQGVIAGADEGVTGGPGKGKVSERANRVRHHLGSLWRRVKDPASRHGIKFVYQSGLATCDPTEAASMESHKTAMANGGFGVGWNVTPKASCRLSIEPARGESAGACPQQCAQPPHAGELPAAATAAAATAATGTSARFSVLWQLCAEVALADMSAAGLADEDMAPHVAAPLPRALPPAPAGNVPPAPCGRNL